MESWAGPGNEAKLFPGSCVSAKGREPSASYSLLGRPATTITRVYRLLRVTQLTSGGREEMPLGNATAGILVD